MSVVRFDHSMETLSEAVVAVGVFDGVHRGHQALLQAALRDAQTRGAPLVALTFDPDPVHVLLPDKPPPFLLSLDDRCSLLLVAGANTVLVVTFDLHLAQLSPERFIREVLCHAVLPLAVHVGADFRFGHAASGDARSLSRIGRKIGMGVVVHNLVEIDGAPATATRIRTLIAAGDLPSAAALLGRPHRIEGAVVRGRGEGATLLGVPTASIATGSHSAVPPDGVYAGRVRVGKMWYPAGISIGRPPTFPQAGHAIEAHLIGYSGDLVDSAVSVEFVERLREQRSFASSAALARAIFEDLAVVRELIR